MVLVKMIDEVTLVWISQGGWGYVDGEVRKVLMGGEQVVRWSSVKRRKTLIIKGFMELFTISIIWNERFRREIKV